MTVVWPIPRLTSKPLTVRPVKSTSDSPTPRLISNRRDTSGLSPRSQVRSSPHPPTNGTDAPSLCRVKVAVSPSTENSRVALSPLPRRIRPSTRLADSGSAWTCRVPTPGSMATLAWVAPSKSCLTSSVANACPIPMPAPNSHNAPAKTANVNTRASSEPHIERRPMRKSKPAAMSKTGHRRKITSQTFQSKTPMLFSRNTMPKPIRIVGPIRPLLRFCSFILSSFRTTQ